MSDPRPTGRGSLRAPGCAYLRCLGDAVRRGETVRLVKCGASLTLLVAEYLGIVDGPHDERGGVLVASPLARGHVEKHGGADAHARHDEREPCAVDSPQREIRGGEHGVADRE